MRLGSSYLYKYNSVHKNLYKASQRQYSSSTIGSILGLGPSGCRFESCLLYTFIK